MADRVSGKVQGRIGGLFSFVDRVLALEHVWLLPPGTLDAAHAKLSTMRTRDEAVVSILRACDLVLATRLLKGDAFELAKPRFERALRCAGLAPQSSRSFDETFRWPPQPEIAEPQLFNTTDADKSDSVWWWVRPLTGDDRVLEPQSWETPTATTTQKAFVTTVSERMWTLGLCSEEERAAALRERDEA